MYMYICMCLCACSSFVRSFVHLISFMSFTSFTHSFIQPFSVYMYAYTNDEYVTVQRLWGAGANLRLRIQSSKIQGMVGLLIEGLHRKPSTLNPKPQTLSHAKPESRSPLNQRPSSQTSLAAEFPDVKKVYPENEVWGLGV